MKMKRKLNSEADTFLLKTDYVLGIWFQNMKTAKLFLIQEMQRSVNGIGSEVSLPRKYFTASQVNSKITICKMKRRNIDDKKCHICVETMSDDS